MLNKLLPRWMGAPYYLYVTTLSTSETLPIKVTSTFVKKWHVANNRKYMYGWNTTIRITLISISMSHIVLMGTPYIGVNTGLSEECVFVQLFRWVHFK